LTISILLLVLYPIYIYQICIYPTITINPRILLFKSLIK
jgi:hypothetical protein